ncbi:Protein stum [Trichinella pseudospiralis]
MVPTPNALQQALRFSLNKVKQSSAKVAAAELTQSNELNLSKDSFSTLSLSTNPPLSTTVCSGTSRGTNFQKSSTDAVVVTVVDPAHTNNTPIGEIVEENHAKPTSIAQTARDRKAINESLIYAAIPFLPLPIAIVCFLLNLLLPGSGKLSQSKLACFKRNTIQRNRVGRYGNSIGWSTTSRSQRNSNLAHHVDQLLRWRFSICHCYILPDWLVLEHCLGWTIYNAFK